MKPLPQLASSENPSSPLTFPLRPSKNPNLSKTDTPTFLITNLYNLSFHPGTSILYQYSLSILPEIAKDNNPLLQHLKSSISSILSTHFSKYISLGYLLFTTNQNAPSFLSVPTTHQNISYTIRLQKANDDPIDLNNISNSQLAKSVIESIIKNIIYSNENIIKFNKRSFYKYNETQSIPGENGYLIPGFTTAVQINRNKLLYMINTNNKYITGISAYERLQVIRKEWEGDMFYKKCEEEFVGKSFLAKYGSFRVYRIDGIAFDKNCTNTEIKINDKDGKEKKISVKHYYKIQYGIDIKDKMQPLFIKYSNMDKKYCCYLVPELLFMTGNSGNGKEYKKRIVTPKEKLLKIQDMQLLLNNTNVKKGKNCKSPYEIKREWGIQLKDCYSFKSRILQSPKLKFANITNDNNNNSLYQYQHLKNANGGLPKQSWICITYFHNNIRCNNIISNFITASKRLNLLIEHPHIYAFHHNEFIDNVKEIKFNSQIKIILIVLCSKYSYLYTDIKQYLNEKGIPSQCILDEKAKTLSYCTRVLTQMISKINGELFHIELDSNLNSKISMIIGIDVLTKNNIIYFCVSSTYSQFHSKVNVEIDYINKDSNYSDRLSSFTIANLICKSLDHFKRVNNKLPSIIMIYRNGGNDIQNEFILQKEVPFIVDLFKGKESYMKDYSPLLCIIAVNKKTDLKFFQQCSNNNNMYANPEKGTVIDDDVIVNEKRFEFYLQSQYVNQGTATPVHFTVLYDDSKIPLEVLENITYKQTYYYWNWNGVIRIPAILKYAEMCNEHLSKCGNTVHIAIKDRPFYL